MTWTAGGGRQSGFLISLRLVGLESGALHASDGLRILHEGVPDKAGAGVLRHQQGDSGVDGDHVAVVPVFQRIKSIHESIRAPGRRIAISDIAQTRMTGCGRNGSEPPAALGTTVPSIGPMAGGPPQTT